MRNPNEKFDFLAIGQAIKTAREGKGWTREYVAEMMDLAPRYIMSIENNGQHPSLQVFYELITLFDISVDQYLFPDKPVKRNTHRRQLDTLLDGMDESGLIVMTATAKGLRETKNTGE